MTKFLRGLLLVDGVNPRNLPEQLCTWPHELLTSSQELRFVSTAVMRSDDGPLSRKQTRSRFLPGTTDGAKRRPLLG